jgi:hypothetical protein
MSNKQKFAYINKITITVIPLNKLRYLKVFLEKGIIKTRIPWHFKKKNQILFEGNVGIKSTLSSFLASEVIALFCNFGKYQ